MLQIEKVLRPVGIGVTKPWLVQATDGQTYIVKTADRMGPQVLIHEYVAGKLGQILKLPMPPVEVISGKNTAGPYVAIRYLPHGHYVKPEHLRQASNLPQMAGLILFDHFFHNRDRIFNHRNLLACRDGHSYVLYGIDHSHLFVKGRWNEEKLRRLAKSYHLIKEGIYGLLLRKYLRPQHFQCYAEAFANISTDQFDQILAEVPDEWDLNQAKQDILRSYWLERQKKIHQICKSLTDLVPNVDR